MRGRMKLGELWDKLNDKFDTLASLWGKEFKTSAGVDLDEYRELWLVKKGNGWNFAVLDKDGDSETLLRNTAGTTRLDAIVELPSLREQLKLVHESTRKEIDQGLESIEKLIVESAMVIQERGEM